MLPRFKYATFKIQVMELEGWCEILRGGAFKRSLVHRVCSWDARSYKCLRQLLPIFLLPREAQSPSLDALVASKWSLRLLLDLELAAALSLDAVASRTIVSFSSF